MSNLIFRTAIVYHFFLVLFQAMKKLIVLILLCITPYCFSETTILHHQIGDQSFFSKEIEIKKDKQFNITKLTPIAIQRAKSW